MENRTDKILKDYSRVARQWKFWVMMGLWIAGTGAFIVKMALEKPTVVLMIGTICSALMAAYCAYVGFAFVKGKHDFKRECAALPNGVSGQFAKARELGLRWFAEDYLLFYGSRRPHIVRYGDIVTAEQRSYSIRLTYNGITGSTAIAAGENPALILAALKAKNEDISFIIKGKVVDTGKRKDDRNK